MLSSEWGEQCAYSLGPHSCVTLPAVQMLINYRLQGQTVKQFCFLCCPPYDFTSFHTVVSERKFSSSEQKSHIKQTRRMAIANWTCVSWVAYARGTIAVYVTWIEREFNACQTPRSMYPSIFNHFGDIAVYRWRVTGFQQKSWANERF